MNAPLRQAERLGRLTTELGPDVLSLLRFDGTDHLNDLYEYQVEALAVRDDLDFDALVGAHATVEIEGREGVQHFDGIVTLDLHRFCSGLLRAILAIKETGYGSNTQR